MAFRAPGNRSSALYLQTGVPRRQHAAVGGPLDASEILRVCVKMLPKARGETGHIGTHCPKPDVHLLCHRLNPASVPLAYTEMDSSVCESVLPDGKIPCGCRASRGASPGPLPALPAAPSSPSLPGLRPDEASCALTAFQRLLCLSRSCPASAVSTSSQGSEPRAPGPARSLDQCRHSALKSRSLLFLIHTHTH